MPTLDKVKQLALQLLDTDFTVKSRGVTYILNAKQLGYDFKFDNAKQRFGSCQTSGIDHEGVFHYTMRRITLSKHLCNLNLDKIDGKIKDTILHELAHAFCNYLFGPQSKEAKSHGRDWTSIAKQIGSDGNRCFSPTKQNIEMPKSKYTLVCPECENESRQHRMSKGSRYSCSICDPFKFNAKYELLIFQNY